ncbi:MAG TPA: ATPase, partial [Arthrobacter sp.]|nr:ATPase [Arthrobacter sp.]
MTNTQNPPATPFDHAAGSPASPLHGITIGLDIGGTKTHGIRFEDGLPVADESAGSSNVQNVSREQAARNLADLFARIGGGTVDRVYAGSGGIDTDEDAAAL